MQYTGSWSSSVFFAFNSTLLNREAFLRLCCFSQVRASMQIRMRRISLFSVSFLLRQLLELFSVCHCCSLPVPAAETVPCGSDISRCYYVKITKGALLQKKKKTVVDSMAVKPTEDDYDGGAGRQAGDGRHVHCTRCHTREYNKRAVLLLLGMCLETTTIMAIKEELRIDVAMALIRSRNDFAACREIANATLVVDLQYNSTDLQKVLPPLLLRTYIVLGRAAALPIPSSLNNPAGLFLCVGR